MRPAALFSGIACLAIVSGTSAGPAPVKAPPPPPPAAGKGPTANAKAKPQALPKPVAKAWAPPSYVAMVKKWHEPTAKPLLDGAGRPKLVLSSINGMGRVELTPLSDAGVFSPVDLDRASFLLRS